MKNKGPKVIGIDIGGTNIQAARIYQNRVEEKSIVNINANGSKIEVVEEVVQAIARVMDSNVQSIGIGVPGLVDYKNGIVYDIVNIPSWDEVPLQAFLEKEFKLPVRIDNDANCFTMGEKYFGKAKEYNDIIGLTLGTGMGAGIIARGTLYCGANSAAGELGMVPYLESNYEAYCSSQFFKNKHNTSGEHIFSLAEQGDKKALEIFNEFGAHLGSALTMIFYAFDPQIIVLGGSISKAVHFFRQAMLLKLDSIEFQSAVKKMVIEVSDLTDAPVLGAAALTYNLN